MSTSPIPHDRRTSPLIYLLLGFSAVWCVLWFVHARGYFEDDAYIHLEFARSLVRGNGFSFNGHIVYGDTSPLWVYLLIGMHAVLPDWVSAGKVLGVIGVVFAAAGAYFLSYRLSANRLFAAAMVAIFVLNPFFSYWAYSGMETITAAGVALWGAYLISNRRLTGPGFLAACVVVGVGPILRPEMSFFSAILAVIVLFRFYEMPLATTRKLPLFAPGVCLAVGPTLIWSLYALRTFGMLVPNTNAAKRAFLHDSIPARIVNLYLVGYPIVPVTILALGGYMVYRKVRGDAGEPASAVQIPVAAWVFLVWTTITSVFYVLNHTYIQTRYVFVSASGFVLLALTVIYLNFPRIWRPATVLTALIAAVLSLTATWKLVYVKTLSDQESASMSTWIRQNIPADAPVAMFNIGEVAFLSEHPIIDTGGITRTGVIPFLGNNAATLNWAVREGATYFMCTEPPVPGSTLLWQRDVPSPTWSVTVWKNLPPEQYKLWRVPDGAAGR